MYLRASLSCFFRILTHAVYVKARNESRLISVRCSLVMARFSDCRDRLSRLAMPGDCAGSERGGVVEREVVVGEKSSVSLSMDVLKPLALSWAPPVDG